MPSYSGMLGTNYIVTWLRKLRGCCNVNFKFSTNIYCTLLVCVATV